MPKISRKPVQTMAPVVITSIIRQMFKSYAQVTRLCAMAEIVDGLLKSTRLGYEGTRMKMMRIEKTRTRITGKMLYPTIDSVFIIPPEPPVSLNAKWAKAVPMMRYRIPSIIAGIIPAIVAARNDGQFGLNRTLAGTVWPVVAFTTTSVLTLEDNPMNNPTMTRAFIIMSMKGPAASGL